MTWLRLRKLSAKQFHIKNEESVEVVCISLMQVYSLSKQPAE